MDEFYLKSIVERILDKEFTDSRKRKTLLYPKNRIQFACPYCGDSHKNPNAKRGNLYFNRLMYVCFNCEKKTTFTKLSKDFNQQIDPEKRMEMIEYINENLQYEEVKDDFTEAKFEKLINFEDLKRVLNSDFVNITDFKPIDKTKGIYKYLINRGIGDEMQKNIYQAKYQMGENNHQWVICMLNRKGDKILGMQIRNLKSGKNRMFKIYNYENLLEWINHEKNVKGEEPIEMDISEIAIYNKLSYYFNMLNVDFSRKITIFEGYLDSLFYPNSIGLVGVSTDTKFLENNNLDIQFFYDNDHAGHKKSEEKIKQQFPVFLWKKLFTEIVERKDSKDPDRHFYRLNQIKDLGKLNELMPSSYKKLKLFDYFSEDGYDLRWIPKTYTKKYIKK
tara:strand:+ start:12305 stop:13474 length:1170 start_codon:yes stop_codon:yes gene_type:complete